jgi:lipid-binding SYLF domain-containing protein
MNRNVHPLQILVAILLLAATAIAGLPGAYAAQPTDKQARSALESLYASSPGAKAKAVLVFPDIHKAALFVGAQSGDGVMFRNGKVAGQYRVDGLLAGIEAGAQSYAYALFFMSDAAVETMRNAKGWEIGADPNIVVVDAGAGKDISTTSLQGDVYSYIFGQKGLMGGIALQGLKITRTGS